MLDPLRKMLMFFGHKDGDITKFNFRDATHIWMNNYKFPSELCKDAAVRIAETARPRARVRLDMIPVDPCLNFTMQVLTHKPLGVNGTYIQANRAHDAVGTVKLRTMFNLQAGTDPVPLASYEVHKKVHPIHIHVVEVSHSNDSDNSSESDASDDLSVDGIPSVPRLRPESSQREFVLYFQEVSGRRWTSSEELEGCTFFSRASCFSRKT